MVGHSVALSNGGEMPVLGLGTWKAAEGGEVERVVKEALAMGYRHIDTAAAYRDEGGGGGGGGVHYGGGGGGRRGGGGGGGGVRESGLKREEVFVTSKLPNDDQRKGY